ncbi:MAG TPA: transketolase [Stellaceae bacterium]|nr:transketolase [Stellaceae bacterium]
MSAHDSSADRAPDLSPIRQHPHYGPLANALRALAMDAVEAAKSGHPGRPMGMADAATVLFAEHLKFDPADPAWPDRDRFVLSAGHGSMLLYGLLHLTGYDKVTLEEIKRFRQWGSLTPGHPEYHHTPGVETTTGPLGQGIATAVGMAIAEKAMAARHGSDLVDHFTYVICGDGCLMEGLSHEAISLAGHFQLGKLIVLWDDNSISIDGPTSLAVSDDQIRRFQASGWHVQAVDGHDPEAVSKAIAAAKDVADKPSMIACKTVIGFGAPTKAGTANAHGAPLGATEIETTKKRLNWPYGPYEVPKDIRIEWLKFGSRGSSARSQWQQRLAAAEPAKRQHFEASLKSGAPEGLNKAIAAVIAKFAAEKPKVATRQSSGYTLDALAPHLPDLFGGSADLTGSNNTKAAGQKPVTPADFSGSYMHWGVREHGMAAAMNGIALHGGLIPYSGAFLVFADYCRPSLRLAALMGIRVIHVMTHDSIGLGEDGPTHQPVETLASLRAIPNMLVMRPADPIEVAECWEVALSQSSTPSVLALSRQAVPQLRTDTAENRSAPNLSAKGAYVLAEASGPRQATLIATGTEVSVAMEARDLLEADGIKTAVVSMPCWELFARQDAAYQARVLGATPNKVAVEAAIEFGWQQWIGPQGRFVGMKGFGASAPAGELYKQFGITAAAIAAIAKEGL